MISHLYYFLLIGKAILSLLLACAAADSGMPVCYYLLGMTSTMLWDLRESGAIEQDADMVIFIDRPAMYDIREFDGGKRTDAARIALSFDYRIANILRYFGRTIQPPIIAHPRRLLSKIRRRFE